MQAGNHDCIGRFEKNNIVFTWQRVSTLSEETAQPTVYLYFSMLLAVFIQLDCWFRWWFTVEWAVSSESVARQSLLINVMQKEAQWSNISIYTFMISATNDTSCSGYLVWPLLGLTKVLVDTGKRSWDNLNSAYSSQCLLKGMRSQLKLWKVRKNGLLPVGNIPRSFWEVVSHVYWVSTPYNRQIDNDISKLYHSCIYYTCRMHFSYCCPESWGKDNDQAHKNCVTF